MPMKFQDVSRKTHNIFAKGMNKCANNFLRHHMAHLSVYESIDLVRSKTIKSIHRFSKDSSHKDVNSSVAWSNP